MAEKPQQMQAQEQERQTSMEQVAQLMSVRARGAVPLAMVRTYGCQQNVADSEKLKGQLEQMGFSFTEDETQADLILFNTCAVRKMPSIGYMGM